MADSLTIQNGWITSKLDSQLLTNNGFYYFEDGPLKCVLMNGLNVSAKVVNRTSKEFFHETVEHSDPRLSLILNANYGDNGYLHSSKVQDPKQDIEGQVIENGVCVADTIGNREPEKACFSFNPKSTDAFRRLFFDKSDPPSDNVAGFGGLVPLIVKGKPFDDSNKWFKNFARATQSDGRLALARSSDSKYLLALLQPHGTKPGMYVYQIRDKLLDGGMRDAVLLDGSTSVMMYLNRSWVVRQQGYKDAVTRVGVGFYYESDAPRAIFDVDVAD
jgi:hypothetical protein